MFGKKEYYNTMVLVCNYIVLDHFKLFLSFESFLNKFKMYLIIFTFALHLHNMNLLNENAGHSGMTV